MNRMKTTSNQHIRYVHQQQQTSRRTNRNCTQNKNGDIIIKSTDQPTRDQLYTNQVNLENKSIKDMVSTMKHQYTSLNLYHLTPKDYFTKSEKSARPLPIRKSLLIMALSKLRQTMTLNSLNTKIGNYGDLALK